GVLLLGALATGARLPAGRELWRTALYGLITIGLGTGSLALSEQWVPSGLASLMVSTQPFWMVGVEAWMPGGERPRMAWVAGMIVGLVGVAFLLAPSATDDGSAQGFRSQAILGGFLALQFGAVAWSYGSVAQRRLASRAHPFVSGGIQQLATGIAFALIVS